MQIFTRGIQTCMPQSSLSQMRWNTFIYNMGSMTMPKRRIYFMLTFGGRLANCDSTRFNISCLEC
ncbi:hypothetical protein [Nostoc sp. KVJ20]|uniref:hypothetical protein n=1 Tax=Nostoc sp. KVJ20 TaxID=457944 RepID=UPI00210B1FBB|nr:hypothetical protein [Nostoc sp. KVJ20]